MPKGTKGKAGIAAERSSALERSRVALKADNHKGRGTEEAPTRDAPQVPKASNWKIGVKPSAYHLRKKWLGKGAVNENEDDDDDALMEDDQSEYEEGARTPKMLTTFDDEDDDGRDFEDDLERSPWKSPKRPADDATPECYGKRRSRLTSQMNPRRQRSRMSRSRPPPEELASRPH